MSLGRYLCINNGPGNQPYVWEYDVGESSQFNQGQSFIPRSNTSGRRNFQNTLMERYNHMISTFERTFMIVEVQISIAMSSVGWTSTI
ncbi:hypothetical protein PV327_006936 [Microctonus hyperodae]|uniref:Uncharacterized protein n=1 Tax=Microctonus hyperodae TaxID=165561 RepID=A0AA39F5G4_MICHY|nr:hypothetical protein PV327_006936 [Microctonus hyperodae]